MRLMITWTDGSADSDALVDVTVAGAGVYLPAAELAMTDSTLGVVEEYGMRDLIDAVHSCRSLAELQTAQRAEFWAHHLGVAGLLALPLGC